MMGTADRPAGRVRVYFIVNKNVDRVLRGIRGVVDGAWLGSLSRESLHQIDEAYYARRRMYVSPEYNTAGLSNWESDAVKNFFPAGGRVVVTGAGSGREVIALQALGYETVGYEPNHALVEAGQRMIDSAGFGGAVRHSARDSWPDDECVWDAAVVGWGSYMLIQGRSARIAFLEAVHAHLQPGAPVLVSFYFRQADTAYFRTVTTVGSFLRRALRRTPVELGDALAPNFVHYFSEEDIRRELDEAGFDVSFFGADEYGHVVGTAREITRTGRGQHG